MRLSDLPIGTKVKDPETTYYGMPIVFQVAAKNHEGYPENSVTLITEKLITLKAFDAKEPSNSDSNRRTYGNNRYLYSNIRQWLNKDVDSWYEPQHETDESPNANGVNYNYYDSESGFLSNFSRDFKKQILTTNLTVVKNTVTDGGESETFQDKIFLPSTTEVGLSNENNIAEGSLLEMFTTASASRIANPTTEAVANSTYTSTSLKDSSPWNWLLRTPVASQSYGIRIVSTSGGITNTQGQAGQQGVRPVLNLPSEIRVYDNPDIDGVYILDTRLAEISVPQGDIGVKTTKNNLLTYNITTKDQMSEVVEKVNGEIVNRKNLANGEETQVNLTNEQWDAVGYGKYTKSPITNLMDFSNINDWQLGYLWAMNGIGNPLTEQEAPQLALLKDYISNFQVEYKVEVKNGFRLFIREADSSGNLLKNNSFDIDDGVSKFTPLAETKRLYICISNLEEETISEFDIINQPFKIYTEEPNVIVNNLTIEMGDYKWDYTFDKRLSDDSDIPEIVKATKEANEVVLPTKKAKIIEAIGEDANESDNLEELANKIIRYASGTCTSSTTTLQFQYAGTTGAVNLRFVEITDIPFIPSKITLSLPNGSFVYKTYYEEDNDPFYPKTIKLSSYQSTSQTSVTTYNLKGDALNAVVSANLVRLPVQVSGITGTWEAWGRNDTSV
ncbi:hypothetical protein J27TS8_05330 [Robertmurraya siralis]|uniref:DUF6273 domain-containing protein n=1 Tax=Robertmurraya siralis TaxID=77777 RepID=A0A919WEL9_9BACI|nr:DUF6273 domain-containing protein [Robertmurraya siralis]GIN60540.1 hypothetical protein J27TS8_05330 [Robertmurraya siralis]